MREHDAFILWNRFIGEYKRQQAFYHNNISDHFRGLLVIFTVLSGAELLGFINQSGQSAIVMLNWSAINIEKFMQKVYINVIFHKPSVDDIVNIFHHSFDCILFYFVAFDSWVRTDIFWIDILSQVWSAGKPNTSEHRNLGLFSMGLTNSKIKMKDDIRKCRYNHSLQCAFEQEREHTQLKNVSHSWTRSS